MSGQHETPKPYRIYLLDEQGHVSGVRVVESTSDEPAVGEAASIIRQSQVEVWQGDRRVSRFHIEPKDNLIAFRPVNPTEARIGSPPSSKISKLGSDFQTFEDGDLLVASENTPANDYLGLFCAFAAILACIAGIVWAATHPI